MPAVAAKSGDAKASAPRNPRLQSPLRPEALEELRRLHVQALANQQTRAKSADTWVAEWVLLAARARLSGQAPPSTPADPELEAARGVCAVAYAQEPATVGRWVVKMVGTMLGRGEDPLNIPGSLERLQGRGLAAAGMVAEPAAAKWRPPKKKA